jgi:tRNA G10  N-methylase Trm11
MKHFFILGRNPELSREEILSYMRARNREHREILFEENFLILETNKDERFNIQEFGGVLKLGTVTFEGNEQELTEYLQKNEIVPADKFSYAIFGNQDPELLKEIFKSRKKKAMLRHGRQQIEFQDRTKHGLPNAEFDVFFHSPKSNSKIPNPPEKVYLGISTQSYDSTKVKDRDMNKPIRREHLAISPRLSKILINLSEAKPHDLLLDPFCGIGGILQEAILKGINAYGIDKDKQATIDAEKNIKWILSKYSIKSTYKIENNDSRKTPDLQFAAIATETPLGKVLKKKPNDNEAQQIIQNFEAYIIPILKRLKSVKKPKAKIAITFPVINNLHANTTKITNKCELKIFMKPILESRQDQFISRDIIVLQ